MATAKLLKQSTVYVALGFLAPAVNFILLPIYAHYLLPADYGIIVLAALVQAVLINLIGLGANGGFARLYYDCRESKTAINALFCSAFFIFIISFVFILIINSAFGSWLFQAAFKNNVFTFSQYGFIIMLTSLSANMQLVVLSLLRNQQRVREYAMWAIIFFLLSAAGIFVGVVGLKWGGYGSVLGRSIGMALPIFAYYITYFLKNKFVVRPYLVKRILNYGLPLVPYLLLNVAFANIDKVFVERYFNMTLLGQYGFAVQIAGVIEIFISSMQSATYPQLYRELKQGYSPTVYNHSIRQIFSAVLIISFLVNAALITFGTLGVEYLINERYHVALSFLPLLCITYIPRVLYTVWGISIMFYGKTKVMPLMNFAALMVGFTTNLILIPIMGIFALPLSLFLSQSVMLFTAIGVTRHFKINVSETYLLRKEHVLGIVLLVITIAASLGYNLIQASVFWYVPIFVSITILCFIFFKAQLRQGAERFLPAQVKKRLGFIAKK